MSNLTALRGVCPAPFFDEAKFPDTGGYIAGRLCATIPGSLHLTCCLPCPAADYLYPSTFYDTTRIPGYIAMGSLALCTFVLLAFLFLPSELSKRHYLNTSLIISIVLLELGIAVPVLAKPEQCANEITPNDMTSSMTCAWSGALIIAGGCACNMWILARVVSMHLQICWDLHPSRTFFWGSQLISWGVTAVLTTVCMILTGVSFRFGDYCHVNAEKALDTLWGPLLGISGLALTLQAATFCYCLKAYLNNLFEDRPTTTGSGPSRTTSSRNGTVRAVYQRVRTVMTLQWRSLAISILVVVDVVYLAVVFLVLNARIEAIVKDFDKLKPWILCVITKSTDECIPYAEPLRPAPSILIATLVLLSIVGIQCCLLISRREMITGWYTSARDWNRKRKSDFVSLDAANTSMAKNMHIGFPRPIDEKKGYELIQISTPSTLATDSSPTSTFQSPTREFPSPNTESIKSPTSATRSPLSQHGDGTEDSFDTFAIQPLHQDLEAALPTPHVPITRERSVERQFHPSRYSFSNPRPPSAGRGAGRPRVEWDPTSTFARPTTPNRAGLGSKEGATSRLQR